MYTKRLLTCFLLSFTLVNVSTQAQNETSSSDLLDLHKQLVEIESISGNEAKVGEFLASYLQSHGWTIERQEVEGINGGPARFNIFAHTGNKNPKVILNSHLDTVPPYVPYRVEGDKIFGRGTNDAKGSIASQVIALAELQKESPDVAKEVGLLYVVSEESGCSGITKANELSITPKAFIIGEPTENKLALGHKGALKFSVNSEGIAAHSGYPELGRSAITQLVNVASTLNSIVFPDSHPVLGVDTLNIGLIQGGIAANVVPASANLTVAVRIATNATKVWETIKSIVGNPQGITLELGGARDGILLDSVDGFETMVAKYGTDYLCYNGKAKKKYLIGPGSILVAHTPNEYILKEDLTKAVGLYKKLVTQVLNTSQRS
ncbi:Zn-dependent exopeptidase [Basidiobolus meristosporus CBS 931.73]|uniref:Zn-dependent exopeptidase n=1 Tax=Basidiobolus meristosporus CBS 931.73 TaxID=1314790 RepID=A0A1Y1YN70_9FUNG|nr:Zn-dependent exopeptidase [Basidiobolus meristosporus CBS 931.73]|eukprot:ORX99452.1 Zn-dependent exopeptidase [Basidiobolus meristosporus CBS 931.73]